MGSHRTAERLSGAVAGAAVYFRTLRPMRFSQLLWRLRYTLERRRPISARRASRWSWCSSRSPRICADLTPPPLPPLSSSEGEQIIALMREGRFRLLHEERLLGRENTNWLPGPVSTGRLWTITLYYHEWAYQLAEVAHQGGPLAREAGDLFFHYISDWIQRCVLVVPGARDLAWNAYALATRIGWWIRAYLALGASWWQAHSDFEQSFLRNLWQQAAYLRDHLEWDVCANHLLRNALGLAWAGRFFDEERSREWLSTATRLALAQVAEQVLPDGGHYERSPMYHVHVMDDVRALAYLLPDAAAQEQLRKTWKRMAEYLAWVRHPDGDLPLFNDGGLAGADHVERVLNCGNNLGKTVDPSARSGGRYFDATGLAVWHGDPWTVFFDVGKVGPDHQPGHAHADTLTLECSFRGRRLFVDAGTHSYDRDERRRYDRSTAAHNAVVLDGQDSSEVWHILRVGRRAYPLDVRVEFTADGMIAEGSHSGYDHLPGRPRPTRRLAVADRSDLEVTDTVEGKGWHHAVGGFLLAPDWTARVTTFGWEISGHGQRLAVVVSGSHQQQLSLSEAIYHPSYGVEQAARRLHWSVAGKLPIAVTFRISCVL